MRRSLFDEYAPQLHKPPRLRPNLFARLAQFSFLHPALVLFFWLALAIGLSIAAFQKPLPLQNPVDISGNTTAAKYQQMLQNNFPSLDTMFTVNVSNADPERLARARQTLVAALEADSENFEIVYAPGTGNFYDTHAILYHSLADVQARVAYAKSLKPLFDAIAEAPTTASLATLVNEVRGSIEQGRDPQGLDELFSESAKAVQALMLGNERPVDWNYVAGLNAENVTTNALVFAVPKKLKSENAANALKAIVSTLPQDDGTTALIDQPQQNKPEPIKTVAPNLIYAGLAMSAVLIIFALVNVLGEIALVTLITLPSLLITVLSFAIFRLVVPSQIMEFWPSLLSLLFIALLMSGRFAFALVESHNIARSKESAVMLAAQKQGSTIFWMGLTAAAMSLCLLATLNLNLLQSVLCGLGVILLACLASLSLGSAIASFQNQPTHWRAKEWLLPISNALFGNPFAKLFLKSVAIAALVGAALGFWFAPNLFSKMQETNPVESTVNILATSTDEAELIVANLKKIPEAQGVRWLGAFLPQQVDEKQKILSELKGQFPSVTPLVPQDVEVLRDHISTLQESLKDIANAPNTRPALKASANEFRQSLELLAATSENKEVLAFENRIFGSFNVLPERSQAFAEMDKPTFASFDQRLSSLFLTADGLLRLEVTPVSGVSNEDLARKLSAARFHVAHPILAVDGAAQSRLQFYAFALAAACFIGVIAVFVFSRSVIEAFEFLVTTLSFVGLEIGFMLWAGFAPNLQNLLICFLVLVFLTLAKIAHFAQPIRHEKSVETLLPIIFLACTVVPFSLLKVSVVASGLGQVLVLMSLAYLCLLAFEALVNSHHEKARFAIPPQTMP